MPSTRSPASSAGPTLETIALPLAIKTLTIDGKKMSLAFFKQIDEEDLINEETGELEGNPLGYINVHQKGVCPDCWHRHFLWKKGVALRHGIVVRPQDAETYQTLQGESRQLQGNLQDLLALRLAHDSHAILTHTGDRYKVEMGERSLSLSVPVYSKLHELEQARDYQEQARATWAESLGSSNHHEGDAVPHPTPSLLEQARSIQSQLSSDIILAHPELTQHVPEQDLMVLGAYGKETKHSRREYKFGWLLYQGKEGSPEQSCQVLWRSKQRATQDITDTYASEIEAHLAPVLAVLPYFLAGQAIEHLLGQIDQRARDLAKQVKLHPAGAKKGFLPNTTRIGEALWDEHQRFQQYTMRWQQNLASLQDLEQLFIVS